MNDGLKQRIIGALVLVALAIIFVPVLFDRERIAPVDRQTRIPPAPDILLEPLPEVARAPSPKDPSINEPLDGDLRIQDSPLARDEEMPPSTDSDVDAEPSADPVQQRIGTEPPAGSQGRSVPKPTAFAVPAIAPPDTDSAWVLQVASYEHKQHAEALANELRTQGLNAFTKKVSTSAGERTRLFVGPDLSKQALLDVKASVDAKYRVNSLLMVYKP